MKPIFKYSGGKSRELQTIRENSPAVFSRVVEPFCGSAAVAFAFEKPALISDSRADVINVFKVVQDKTLYPYLQELVDKTSAVNDHDDLERIFYTQRDEKWTTTDPLERAFRFLVIRQLVFSGIDRINVKTGKENAPFGHYPKFSCYLSEQHHKLLQTWDIKRQDWSHTMDEVVDGDFVFLDPPYLGRNSTYGEEQELESLHVLMMERLSNLSHPWLLVHCEHPSYQDFLTDKNVYYKPHTYSQNFLGRNNSKQKTQHFYATNFMKEESTNG